MELRVHNSCLLSYDNIPNTVSLPNFYSKSEYDLNSCLRALFDNLPHNLNKLLKKTYRVLYQHLNGSEKMNHSLTNRDFSIWIA